MTTISPNHWITETYAQRMTAAEWKAILLAGDDRIFFRGELYYLKARRLGAGVVEVTKRKAVYNPDTRTFS